MKFKKPIFVIFQLLVLAAPKLSAQTTVSVEGAAIWQSRNDQRIPGNGGTQFSLSDLAGGPFPGYRLYLGHRWNNRHEVRALYAPLQIEADGRLPTSVVFQNSNFAAGAPTTAFYRFNSYRLTYAYHFDKSGDWSFAFGFTGKIRDAEVRLTQGSLVERKANIGFVPLLNFQARYQLSDKWRFRFDFDGLAAPQGRAFDVAVFWEREAFSPDFVIFGGYRTIEGGADNDQVYNFAWIHQAVLGWSAQF